MTEIKLYAAKKLDKNVPLETEVKVVSWRVFYGVEPGTEPMLNRSGFGIIQTMPIPTESMITGSKVEVLCDVVDWNGRSKKGSEVAKNTVIAQRKIEVEFDDLYVGYYALIVFRNLGITPDIPVEKLEKFDPNMPNAEIEKIFGTKEMQGNWAELRRMVVKASAQKMQWDTLTVDMDSVNALCSQMGLDEKTSDAVRTMAKSQPAAYAALKQKWAKTVTAEVLASMIEA